MRIIYHHSIRRRRLVGAAIDFRWMYWWNAIIEYLYRACLRNVDLKMDTWHDFVIAQLDSRYVHTLADIASIPNLLSILEYTNAFGPDNTKTTCIFLGYLKTPGPI